MLDQCGRNSDAISSPSLSSRFGYPMGTGYWPERARGSEFKPAGSWTAARENPEGALAEASTLSGFSSLLESGRGPNSGRELPLTEASDIATLGLPRSFERCNPSVRSFPRLRREVCESLNSLAVENRSTIPKDPRPNLRPCPSFQSPGYSGPFLQAVSAFADPCLRVGSLPGFPFCVIKK